MFLSNTVSLLVAEKFKSMVTSCASHSPSLKFSRFLLMADSQFYSVDIDLLVSDCEGVCT